MGLPRRVPGCPTPQSALAAALAAGVAVRTMCGASQPLSCITQRPGAPPHPKSSMPSCVPHRPGPPFHPELHANRSRRRGTEASSRPTCAVQGKEREAELLRKVAAQEEEQASLRKRCVRAGLGCLSGCVRGASLHKRSVPAPGTPRHAQAMHACTHACAAQRLQREADGAYTHCDVVVRTLPAQDAVPQPRPERRPGAHRRAAAAGEGEGGPEQAGG